MLRLLRQSFLKGGGIMPGVSGSQVLFDVRGLIGIERKLDIAAAGGVMTRFSEEFLLGQAQKMLDKLREKTPVDTGRLRAGWIATGVQREGTGWAVDVYNEVPYASYVEKGWESSKGTKIRGRFMMQRSAIEIEQELPKDAEQQLQAYLDNFFAGR